MFEDVCSSETDLILELKRIIDLQRMFGRGGEGERGGGKGGEGESEMERERET